MEYVDDSRYIDALLLLSLRAREEEEYIIDSTSCFSSMLLKDLTKMGYINYSKQSRGYTITEKGKLTLKYVKKPWNAKNMRKGPQFTTRVTGHYTQCNENLCVGVNNSKILYATI